jgi:hypothetical protein
MTGRHYSYCFPLIFILVGAACGSLISETERIKQAYYAKNPTSVVTTDPADNTIAPYNQTYIDVTFSSEIDAATFVAQTTFGACSGSFQVSYDLFNNCLAGTVDSSANPRIRFIPTVFPKGLGLQIRITSSVISSVEVPVTPYTSPVGFRLGAPCGNFNCFFSLSTPLMAPAAGSNGVFLIRTGVHAGKALAYSTGTALTTIIDPATATSIQGPNLCLTPTGTVLDFYAAGTANNGMQILILGTSGSACLYNPATNTFSTGFTVPSAGSGAYIFDSKADTDVFFVQGSPSPLIYRYNSTLGNMITSYDTGTAQGDGSHQIRMVSGSNGGQSLLFAGNSSMVTRNFNDTGILSGGPTSNSNVSAGAASIEVTNGGNAGKVVTIVGGNTTTTSVYDLVAGGASASGNTLLHPVATGAQLLRQSGTATYDQPLIIAGGTGLGSVFTNKFDSATLSFSNGPLTTGRVLQGSASIYVPRLGTGGGFFILNGNLSTSTSVYLPSTGQFHGSRMPGTSPNLGSNSFVISGGPQNGKTLIVSGNGVNDTAIFDPLKFEMSAGPVMPLTGTTSMFNVPITQGANAGAVLVFVGGGANTFNLYVPGSNSFPTPTGFPTFGNMGSGAGAFQLANSSKIIIIRGGASTTADVYDQVSNSVSGPIALGCSVNSIPLNYTFTQPSTGTQVQAIYCQGTTLRLFNHTTQVALSPVGTLSATPGNGMQIFRIPSGSQAGNLLIIHGNGLTSTDLLIAETGTLTSTGAPAIPASCAPSNGAQILAITTGLNAGKFLLLAGGGSAASCLYDPQLNQFTTGPSVSNTISPGFQISAGSLAFKTNGGLYPTSFIVLSGATKNVWSTYVP